MPRNRLRILANCKTFPDTGSLSHASTSSRRFDSAARPAAFMLTPHSSDPIAPPPGCDVIRTDFFAACEGELTPAALLVIETHLAQCEGCRERFAADAVFLGAVRRAASLDIAPQSLRDRVALTLHARTTENASA